MEQVDTLWGRALWGHDDGGHPNYEKDKRAPVSKIETKMMIIWIWIQGGLGLATGINRYTRTGSKKHKNRRPKIGILIRTTCQGQWQTKIFTSVFE